MSSSFNRVYEALYIKLLVAADAVEVAARNALSPRAAGLLDYLEPRDG